MHPPLLPPSPFLPFLPFHKSLPSRDCFGRLLFRGERVFTYSVKEGRMPLWGTGEQCGRVEQTCCLWCWSVRLSGVCGALSPPTGDRADLQRPPAADQGGRGGALQRPAEPPVPPQPAATRWSAHTHTHTLSVSLSLSHTHTHSLSLSLTHTHTLTHQHTHALTDSHKENRSRTLTLK